MAQLRSLSLNFHPRHDHHHINVALLSRKRIILPALTNLNFRGINKYLEDLVVGVDSPRLADIKVAFFNEFTFDLSKLSEFVNKIEMHKSHRRAYILSSEDSMSVSFIRQGASARLRFQVFCERSSEQLDSMARICVHFSEFIFNVEDLRASATRPSDWLDRGYCSMQWRELINSFTGVKRFHVAGNLWTDIVRALRLPYWRRGPLLPALCKLYTPYPGPRHTPPTEALVELVTSRRFYGHSIGVEYEGLVSGLYGTGTACAQYGASTTR